jgi:hypothetical protein
VSYKVQSYRVFNALSKAVAAARECSREGGAACSVFEGSKVVVVCTGGECRRAGGEQLSGPRRRRKKRGRR